jgi:hypothetical protein
MAVNLVSRLFKLISSLSDFSKTINLQLRLHPPSELSNLQD